MTTQSPAWTPEIRHSHGRKIDAATQMRHSKKSILQEKLTSLVAMGIKYERMKKSQQQTFNGFSKTKDCFGGSLLKNSNAKTARPLSSKLPIHLVLRSGLKGSVFSMHHPRSFEKVNQCVRVTARKHGIKIYEYANVGNHMHLLIKLRSVPGWKPFIRELTGRLSQVIQNRKPQAKHLKCWAQRPFTRIVRGWGRAYHAVKDYVLLNQMESAGLISRMDRNSS